MNKEMFEGNWNILKGKAKEKWGKLTDDDLMRINGKREQLVGELQKKYGFIKLKAEEEVANWEKSCGSCGCENKHHENKHEHEHDQHHETSHHAKSKQKW